MGITLKVRRFIFKCEFQITEDGRCLVARIMHGGLIHRQGMRGFEEI